MESSADSDCFRSLDPGKCVKSGRNPAQVLRAERYWLPSRALRLFPVSANMPGLAPTSRPRCLLSSRHVLGSTTCHWKRARGSRCHPGHHGIVARSPEHFNLLPTTTTGWDRPTSLHGSSVSPRRVGPLGDHWPIRFFAYPSPGVVEMILPAGKNCAHLLVVENPRGVVWKSVERSGNVGDVIFVTHTTKINWSKYGSRLG